MKQAQTIVALLILIFTFLTISSCKSKESQTQTSISKSDYKSLMNFKAEEAATAFLKTNGDNVQIDDRHFISIIKGQFDETIDVITSQGGEIIYADKLTGYIHFKSSATKAFKMVGDNLFEVFIIDKPIDTKIYKYKESSVAASNEMIINDISSVKLMKADKLIQAFKEQYGVDLNCSTSTIAVFDTGIDISRTDIFQDRIVHMRSIRNNDVALLTDAEEIDIDGKIFISANLNGVDIQIEKTKKLEKGTDFYIGVIIEKLLKGSGDGYDNYDLNQDGKDTGVFPIIVYKTDQGNFEAYINVNDKLTYGDKGDQTIEDENLLVGFNWAVTNVKDRFVTNVDPAKSYYKFTTRFDIITEQGFKKDRTKGLMNMAITLEPGIELNKDGTELKLVQKTQNGQNIYRVGLAGYDINGHGTHVTGIAAGNFQKAPEYSSACTQAKIINVANIGASQHTSYFDEIIKLSKKHKNIVFNFSFGSNNAINDTQGPQSKLMDTIAKTYNIPFVKAAGNEGPGLKSHGTTISQYTISVANYMTSNALQFFGYGTFEDNKVWPSTSSSRGPMHDGALKPDIGAPGWVLSSVPLAKPMGSNNNRSYQYWPGTSMASPNAASIVALLLDAAEKSGLSEFTENSSENYQAVTLDKIRKALLNSAIPYDTFSYTNCSSSYGTSFAEWCKPFASEFKFNWLEGGAGRINAAGAWNILESIHQTKSVYFKTETNSKMLGYNQQAVGYFNIGETDSIVDVKITMDAGNTPSELTRHERLTLKIPENIDWLSFDRLVSKKEKVIDVFGTEKAAFKLFISREKLVVNGRLKPGLHHTVIKGFNIDTPDVFDLVFPVTIIGYHTNFDMLTENFQFGVTGFTPKEMFQRFFIPVKDAKGSVILNLNTSPSMPGDLSMHVFNQGLEIPTKDLMASTRWVLSTSEYGEGRNSLKFVINGMSTGLHEVILQADRISNYLFQNLPGSYFQFSVGEMSLNIENIRLRKMNDSQYVVIENAINHGSALRISEAVLKIKKLKNESSIVVQDKKSIIIPITIPEDIFGIIIETSYLGFTPKTDIDIELLTLTGAKIAGSGANDSNERIITKIKPGSYLLKVLGYNVPNGSEEFGLKTAYLLSKPIKIVDKFIGATKKQVLKDGFRWHHNKLYNFKAQFDMSKVTGLPEITDTTPSYTIEIKASYGNAGQSTSIYNKDFD